MANNFAVSHSGGVRRYPENRPETALDNIFGRLMPSASPEALARVRQRKQSILDFVRNDLTSLRGRVPKEQLPKLDSHLEGKALGLRRGTNLQFGGKRYMTDVWAAVSGAFGAPIARFGDPAWSSGAVSGLFG